MIFKLFKKIKSFNKGSLSCFDKSNFVGLDGVKFGLSHQDVSVKEGELGEDNYEDENARGVEPEGGFNVQGGNFNGEGNGSGSGSGGGGGQLINYKFSEVENAGYFEDTYKVVEEGYEVQKVKKTQRIFDLVLTSIHFVVKFDGCYYTNNEFTNVLRLVLIKLSNKNCVFTFKMNFINGGYRVVYEAHLSVNTFSKVQALNLSSCLAKTIYKDMSVYDKTSAVKLRVTCVDSRKLTQI